MAEASADNSRQPWWKKGRMAAIGVGIGATLALSPVVWAETAPAPAAKTTASYMPAAPQTMTSPAALMQQQSFAPLVKKVLPAVVNISVTEKPSTDQMSESIEPQSPNSQGLPNSPFDQLLRRFFNQQHGGEGQMMPHGFSNNPQSGGQEIALGSGFIIDPAGYIVTNNHVVGKAEKVTVILQDGNKYRARIVGRDPKTDLAVLKIKAPQALPYVQFGNSSAAQIGDWVVAVGNPFGLGGTVTTGIVSARGRDIDSGPFDDFLQIDAPINRGNSGGPTFDLEGQVIGINTAIYSPNGGSVGIGFAIPSNVAKPIIAQLIEHGKVSRGWLGVQIQTVTPAIAASLGLHNEAGALVAVVNADSPGAKAGLKQGDVILSFDGAPVAKLRDLPRLVAAAAPDSAAQMTVWRDGHTLDLHATLAQYPANPQLASAEGGEAQPEQATALGLHFGALTSSERSSLQIGKNVTGVLITGVDNGSVADDLGLTQGDVVVSINQQAVQTPDQAAQKLKDIAKSPQKNALLLLNRHGVTQYVGIDLGKNPTSNQG